MARYFFHIFDGVDLADEEGTEFATITEVQQEAVRYAGTVIADKAKAARLGEDWRMEVTDANGLVLFRLDFHIAGTAATTGSSWKDDITM